MKLLRAVLWLSLALLLLGCGGGGGGGSSVTATIVGRVLWIETNAATDPAASVNSGSNSTTTDIVDGSFVLNVAPGTNRLTVSYAQTGSSSPIVMTFFFSPVSGTVDVGDLYIGPETVTVHGIVHDASNDLPVSGATVALAGRTAVTDINGEFNLLDVAYSSTSPAAFGDLIGEVSKTTYVTRQFSPPTTAVGGVVEVGTLQISPESLGTPPPLPSNLTGTIMPVGDGAGATVELLDGTTVVRTTTADSSGHYQFWIGAGIYTIQATNGAKSGSANVTVTSPNVQKIVNVTIA
ncbi:MAG TPA: hypothetical protein VNI20_11945 [Fimbriimonadaceae bacterium]|nr:hypothetical protein [Fimbriimonadaceae bacterium]